MIENLSNLNLYYENIEVVIFIGITKYWYLDRRPVVE